MSIRKIVVTKGVYFIEIPKADIYLLCGSPVDSVKHLQRRGLIQTTELSGITFENGPNAILLSDVAVQNGQLCNLIEFPILQMLYRQGMIIPNHPNNGKRPKLIGTPDQLAAQVRYVHRGNYGLVSAKEMIEAGVDEVQAEEIMRIKLKFAFGHIVPPEQFIDCLPLTNSTLEAGNGVSVTRLALNVFEIRYGSDSVQVDLNLGREETYPCPYPLSHYSIDRHYFAIVHSGDGDGWDVNRPGMSSIIIHQGRVYLIDAGANIDFSLQALGIGKKEVAGIFITHCHDDHFSGLTTLIQSDQPLHFYSAPLVRASVIKKLCAVLSIPESEVAGYFDFYDLEVGKWNDIMGLEVFPAYSPHPVETTIFKFRVLWEGGYRTYTHLADIASFSVLDSMATSDASLPGLSAERVSDMKACYLDPADLKKIDVGGGMIHGNAHDFFSDSSNKLLLSHTSRHLSDSERRIGSGAPFGTIDVMIPGEQNFLLRDASDILRGYFPTVPPERLHMLLNNRIVNFNPESIITPAGKVPEVVYLILAGQVEMLMHPPAGTHFLFCGSFIAETAAINQLPSAETYRSIGFVQALRLPADLYRNFVERFHSSEELIQVREIQEQLRRTFIFSDAVTCTTLFALSKACRISRLHAGEVFNSFPQHLHLIVRGRLARSNSEISDSLGKDEFWGEDELFASIKEFSDIRDAPTKSPKKLFALDSCEIYSLPLEIVASIPIARWKLFEAFRNTHPYAAPRYRGTMR